MLSELYLIVLLKFLSLDPMSSTEKFELDLKYPRYRILQK